MPPLRNGNNRKAKAFKIARGPSDRSGRMSFIPPQEEDLRQRTNLLREVTELLMWELSTISERKWEHLTELKRQKSVLAERLRAFDWTPGPEEHESLDLLMLKSQITDLEYQSKQKISMQLKAISQQLDVLRGQKQNWLHCVNNYFGKTQSLAGVS